MEKCGFQSELLSVLEALARAAVAEINRRVEDSCAVLRLEVSRGRRDIELLKGKCELMEAELRRSRLRARRRVVYSPAPPLVRVVVQSKSTAGQVEAEAPLQPQQCDDADEAEHMQIKEECSEEDVWRNEPLDKTISAAEPCFKASPAPQTSDSFLDSCFGSVETSTEPLVPLSAGHAHDSELLLKHEQEEEPDPSAAPLEAGLRSAALEGDDQLWLTSLGPDGADPNLTYVAAQQIPDAFVPQNGLRAQDTGARIQPAGRCPTAAMANATRAKRRARTFGFRRAQAEEHAAHAAAAASQLRSSDPSSAPQHLRDVATSEAATTAAVHPPYPGHGGGGGGFALSRRIRTPWRSVVGVKRFSCTYCDKTFMRFSQLKEHLRSHTGEKPFSCLQCGRSFTKHCNLVRHAVVHSGEKPYACALCGKCFTQRSSLKSHQKTAH